MCPVHFLNIFNGKSFWAFAILPSPFSDYGVFDCRNCDNMHPKAGRRRKALKHLMVQQRRMICISIKSCKAKIQATCHMHRHIIDIIIVEVSSNGGIQNWTVWVLKPMISGIPHFMTPPYRHTWLPIPARVRRSWFTGLVDPMLHALECASDSICQPT